MHRIYANLLNEVQKLWLQRRTKLFLVLTAFIPIVTAIVLTAFQSSTSFSIGLGSDFPLLMLGLFTSVFLPLFIFMAAADSFSGEEEAGTLKIVLVRPIARSKIFASKILAIAVAIVVYLTTLWLMSTFTGLFLGGGEWFSGLIDSVKAYLATGVSMMAVALVAVAIAQWVKSSTTTLVLTIFIYAIAKLLPFLFPQADHWSVFAYTDWYTLWIGSTAAWGTLINGFLFLLSSSMLLYTLGWYRFEQKQF
ncbi:ABC transporter permease [Desmospora activa]|uniref:ABC-2 type transport system permease protein n=1 Tax=Desmospora activa DSM 45169 TaxID=1121389 RepID=A0A2T4ZCQ5_9BACL|nr:ABC transporter permease [Desmospora activa]PTM59667.1 ABC-2 type transport system permease protein [Desmospora activa DSM 45169]